MVEAEPNRNELLNRYRTALVRVEVTGRDIEGKVVQPRCGTGVVVGANGVIVTAKHVVGKDEEWAETTPGSGCRNRIVSVTGLDQQGVERSFGVAAVSSPMADSDLALLWINARNLQPPPLADQVPPDNARLVALLWEREGVPEPVSVDLVTTNSRFKGLLTLRMAVVEGNSGSGLFDAQFRLTAIITNRIDERRALAIPVSWIKPTIDRQASPPQALKTDAHDGDDAAPDPQVRDTELQKLRQQVASLERDLGELRELRRTEKTRANGWSELKQTVHGEEFPAPKAMPAVRRRARAALAPQPLPTTWSIINPKDYRAIDDVSLSEIPWVGFAAAVMMGSVIAPVTEQYFVHKDPITVTLGGDSAVDNLPFSGALPDDPELRKRVANVGVTLSSVMPELRRLYGEDQLNLEDAYKHFGINEALPRRRDGTPDVEKAFGRLYESSLRGELPPDFLSKVDDFLLKMIRTDLPIRKELRNSMAFVIYKGQDIIDSHPFLRFLIGGDLSLWQFITNIQRIFPSVSTGLAISKMRWAGDQASFQIATRLNNVRVRGQATSVSIDRLFFVSHNDDHFQVAQATLISGPLIDPATTQSIKGDVRRILDQIDKA